MAKVTGALFSVDASGAFAGKLVFAKWKGRQYVRNLVIPSNPQTTAQQEVRNAIRALAAGQRFANLTALMRSGQTSTDKQLLTAAAPSGQAWNGFLVKSAIGSNMVQYDAASAAWTALAAGEKTAWNSAAAALTPAIPAVAQYDADGAPATSMTAGEVFFHYVYGLYIAGVAASAPTATPPTYA